MSRQFAEFCRALADEAFRLYGQCLTWDLYLCGTREQNGTFSAVRLVRDEAETDADTLILAERIPAHLTVEQLSMWLQDRLRREPILPAVNAAQF